MRNTKEQLRRPLGDDLNDIAPEYAVKILTAHSELREQPAARRIARGRLLPLIAPVVAYSLLPTVIAVLALGEHPRLAHHHIAHHLVDRVALSGRIVHRPMVRVGIGFHPHSPHRTGRLSWHIV